MLLGTVKSQQAATMARDQTIAGLVGLLCVGVVVITLPSFVLKVNQDRTALLQTSSNGQAQFEIAKRQLGTVLRQSMGITAPKAKTKASVDVNPSLLSRAERIKAEARKVNFLAHQVMHREEVIKKTKKEEHEKQHELELAEQRQHAEFAKELSVAKSLYDSSLQKLRVEQAKAASLLKPAAVKSAPKAAAAAAKPPASKPPAAQQHTPAPRAHAAPATPPSPPKALAHRTHQLAQGKAHAAQAKQKEVQAMRVQEEGKQLRLLSPVDGKVHMPMPPGPTGGPHAAEYPPKYEHPLECPLPKVLNKDLGCYDDPRSEPLPAYCRTAPHGAECKKYHHELKERTMQYFVDLRTNYPYRYHWHFYQNKPGHRARHLVQPQRFPHRDGADLGDNYISGWHDRSRGKADLDDRLVSGLDLKSHNPAVLDPFAPARTDDRRGPEYKEQLKPPIAAMEKRGGAGTFDDEIVPWDHRREVARGKAWPTLQASRDRIEPAGEHEQQILKGFEDEHLDPFGINGALKDQEVPAGKVYREHRGHNYWREDEGEPFSDFILGGWGGWKGRDVLPEDAQKANELKWDENPPADDGMGFGDDDEPAAGAGAGAGAGDGGKEFERDPGTPDKKNGFVNLPK